MWLTTYALSSYVQKIYDTKVLGIKTFNYMGKTKRSRQNQEKRVLVKDPKYKRVVITLDHLFEYPSAQGKKKQAEVHDGQSKVAEHVPTPPKPWDKDVAARKKALSKEKAKKRYARKVKVAQLKLEQAQGAKASSQKIKPKPASAKPKPAPVKTPAAVAESSQPAESSKPKAKKAKAVSGDNKKIKQKTQSSYVHFSFA